MVKVEFNGKKVGIALVGIALVVLGIASAFQPIAGIQDGENYIHENCGGGPNFCNTIITQPGPEQNMTVLQASQAGINQSYENLAFSIIFAVVGIVLIAVAVKYA